MAIVGFNFTKINVEKKAAIAGKISIDNNVAIKNVSEIDLAVGAAKQKGIQVLFEFTSKYKPDIGGMLFTGEILFMAEPKKQDEILKGWKKDKKLPKDVMSELINSALSRCNIEALILSRDIALPPPIPMPKLTEQG